MMSYYQIVDWNMVSGTYGNQHSHPNCSRVVTLVFLVPKAVTLVLKRTGVRSGVTGTVTISTITFATSSLSGSPSTFANTDVIADDILTLEVTQADSNNVMENIYWTIGGKL
jgi:hypothetical protein